MATTRDTIGLYWKQARKHKPSFFTMLITIPISALMINALLAYFFSQAIGQLISGDTSTVIINLSLAAGVGLLGFLLNYIGFQALVHHESKVISLNRNAMFEQLIQKDLRFFVNQKVGALTSKYIEFVRGHLTIQNLLVVRTAGLVLSLATGLFLIALQSWIVALILLALLVGLIIEVKWSLKVRTPYRYARRDLRAEVHGKVADGLTNSLIVKTFARETQETEELRAIGRRFDVAWKKDLGFVATEGSFRILILILTQIIAISVSAWLVVEGRADVSTVIFSLTYLQLVGSQIFMIGDLLNGYEDALLEASPMTEMLMQANQVIDSQHAIKLKNPNPTITLDGVSYRYDDNKEDVLRDVTLDIPAGQKVGLVGRSGAGKTTITQLLLRFDDVTKGEIRIDGHAITNIQQKSLRQHIAYVPQEPMLFHRSLRENIAYGKQHATEEEIIRAAQQANALEFINELPNGLDTHVGERGVKLSGGQRQRIAIARAILKDAPILILDEATSALDSESEKLIQGALKKLMKGRTSIVIAHRLSTIASLDRIIVLEQGRIIEDGSHQELLAKKGLYRSLWDHQSGGFIEE